MTAPLQYLLTMIQTTHRQRTWQMGRNNVVISMRAPLPDLMITVKVVVLEELSFSDTQNPKTVC